MDKYSSNAVFLTLILWITTYSLVCSTTTDITSSTTDSMSTTTMQNTNMTVNTSMTNTTTGPVTNSTTTTTGAPGTTDADTLFLAQKSENSVTLTFYTVKENKFPSDDFVETIAEEITSYCQQMDTECRVKSSGVVFLSSDVYVLNTTQIARNLDVIVAVAYPFNTSIDSGNMVLSKTVLRAAITERRENIGDAVGYNVIQIDDGKMYHIKADNALNIIISVVFVLFTVLLLIIVLLIRSSFKQREDKDRKELIQAKLRRKEQEGQIYKIRPGPEPIERLPSTPRQKRDSPPDNYLVNRQGRSRSNQYSQPKTQNGHTADPEKGKTYSPSLENTTVTYLSDNNDTRLPAATTTSTHQIGMAPAGTVQSSPKLPPLDNSSTTESPSAEKKKKKKRKRKNKEQDRTEFESENRGDNSVVTFTNSAYDQEHNEIE